MGETLESERQTYPVGLYGETSRVPSVLARSCQAGVPP